jgi:glycosyltransferase involved in cell wall biosynthesis
LACHAPVVVILDASTDGSDREAERTVPGLGETWFLLRHERNAGKGAAVLTGLRWARDHGWARALVVDADGQHPVESIPEFIALGQRFPGAMILGVPVFGPEAPRERVEGRKIGNWWTNLATLWGGIGDSLFGFRLYPVEDSLEIMERIRTARRFDFDTELAVRLYWRGVRPINRRVPVYYPAKESGGVSHFGYIRDNLLLLATHTRLFFGMLARWPALWEYRRRPPLQP